MITLPIAWIVTLAADPLALAPILIPIAIAIIVALIIK
jgi:hypothetical protein